MVLPYSTGLNEYYGDNLRWFLGTVVDVNDPDKLDRVKVRVYGIHTSNTVDIPNDKLPWARVLIPVTEGGSSGLGANSQIKVKAFVFGLFLDGKDSQLPLVLGSMPKEETSVNDKSESSAINRDINTENVNVPAPTLRPFAEKEDGFFRDNVDGRPGGPLKGNNNNEKALNFFLSVEGGRFSIEQASGILGNLIEESGGFNGGIIDPNQTAFGEGSYGIAQWNPQPGALRYQDLVAWCSKQKLDFTRLYPQLKFIIVELERDKDFGLKELRDAKSAEEAAEIFRFHYERPAKDPIPEARRIKFASEIYNKYGPGASIQLASLNS